MSVKYNDNYSPPHDTGVLDIHGNSISFGTVVELVPPKKSNTFYYSDVGKMFEEGIIDRLTIDVNVNTQCFGSELKTKFYKNGKQLSLNEIKPNDKPIEGYDEPYEELTNFTFFKYLAGKGLKVIT